MSDARGTERIGIAVVGLGYVGLTTAVGLAALGHDVTGVDIDQDRVATLLAGRVPMHEPGLQQALTHRGANLSFTSSLEEALSRRPQAIMIAVQTPGESGTAFVEAAARQVGRVLRHPSTVVLRSTVPLGTGRRIAEILAEERGAAVAVASNPEFLVEGRAYEAFMRPDRIVIGADDEASGRLLCDIYAAIDAPVIVTDVATAELAKYAANAFLATQVSFINEMADVASAAGADVVAVSRIIKLDKRVGERAYLNPGVGYGGSCLPKDVRALSQSAQDLGVEPRLLRAVDSVNEERPLRVIEVLRRTLGSLDGRAIAVWGLAFKGGTDDVRDSPAIRVVQRLLAAGAHVRAYDPLAEHAAQQFVAADVLCDELYEPLDRAEALLVLTDCCEFPTADLEIVHGKMKTRSGAKPVIIDGRNMLSGEAVRAAGFTYIGVGESGTETTEGALGAPGRTGQA